MGERAGVLGELRAAQLAHVAMRLTARERMSAENSWSRKTVRPSFRQSWNQSRQVMRLPVQLWKYSCATTPRCLEVASVAVSASASTIGGR
jgi:hypothetical protein